MKISVIIPVYNVGELLCHCVESVISQNSEDCEIIIVDDGSTDNSGTLCDSYATIDNVTVLHKKNGGLSSARNAGIDAAKGDYLLFLDSDDYLRPGSLALLASIIKDCKNTPDFIQYKYTETSDYSDRRAAGISAKTTEIADKKVMLEQMLKLGGIGASACTKLIARHIFNIVRFKEGIIHEDELFTTHMLDYAERGIYIDEDLYIYVVRPGSIITSKYSHKRLDIIPVLEEQIAILEKNDLTHLSQQVCSKLFTSLCILYIAARKAHNNADAYTIARKAKCIAKSRDLTIHGTMGIIARGIRYGLPMLPVYYLFNQVKNGKN